MDYWKELATKHARELWRVIAKHARDLWGVTTKHARDLWGVTTEQAGELWRFIGDPRRAPLIVAVTISGIIISGILFAAFSWAYRTVLIQKEAAINGQQITIADLDRIIVDLRAENADLRSRLSVKPTQSTDSSRNSLKRDPDGIFQFGTQVGKVTGTEADRENSTVLFKNIFSEGNFNPNNDFEYRDLVLHVKNMRPSVSGKLIGKKIDQYINVECLIAGRNDGMR